MREKVLEGVGFHVAIGGQCCSVKGATKFNDRLDKRRRRQHGGPPIPVLRPGEVNSRGLKEMLYPQGLRTATEHNQSGGKRGKKKREHEMQPRTKQREMETLWLIYMFTVLAGGSPM